MIRSLMLGLMMLLAAACEPSAPPRLTPAPTVESLTTLSCESISRALPVSCAETGRQLILQAPLQVTLYYKDLNLTFDSTLWLDQQNPLVISPLEGIAIASINGRSQVIQPGTWVEINLQAGQSIPTPTAYDPDVVSIDLLDILPQAVELPPVLDPEATEEPRVLEVIPTESGECTPREDWEVIYTVRAGDSYARISRRHNINMRELLEANCASGDEVLMPGDTMRVPTNVIAGAPSTPARFYSDRASLPPGECTILYWEAEETRTVALNSEQVEAQGTKEVCPGQTTQYTLRVQFNNGVEATYTLSVAVVLELSE